MSLTNRKQVSNRRGAPRWLPGVLGLVVLAAICGVLGAYILAPVLSPASEAGPSVRTAAAPAPDVPVVTYPSGENQVRIVEKPITPPPAPKKDPERESRITTTIEPSDDDADDSTRGRSNDRDDDPGEGDARAKSGAAETPRTRPGAATPPVPDEPGITIEPAPAETSRTAPTPPTERPAAEGGSSLYRVQVGRFADEGDARALAEELKRDGLTPSIVKTGPEGKGLYRVQVGTYRQRENADKTLDTLRKKQLEPYLAEDEP